MTTKARNKNKRVTRTKIITIKRQVKINRATTKVTIIKKLMIVIKKVVGN